MKNKSFVLFDLDGTLTDPQEGITNSIKYALSHYGIEANDYSVLLSFIGPPLVDSFCEHYGFSEEKAFEAVLKYREYFIGKKGIFENKVFDGVYELLQSLNEAGKKCILVTSKPETQAVEILKHFDLKKYFYDVCGASFDEKLSKKTDILKFAVGKNNIDTGKAVMVGDRKFDIEAAKCIKMSSVGVSFGFGSREELENAGADIIADSVEELKNIFF